MVDLKKANKLRFTLKIAVKGMCDRYYQKMINEANCKECGTRNEIFIFVCETCGSLIKTEEILDEWERTLFNVMNSFDNLPNNIRKIYHSTCFETFKSSLERYGILEKIAERKKFCIKNSKFYL